ncbi:hypothetical protein C8R45DRAFT_1138723, partial [Mycena sanguinolenta]
ILATSTVKDSLQKTPLGCSILGSVRPPWRRRTALSSSPLRPDMVHNVGVTTPDVLYRITRPGSSIRSTASILRSQITTVDTRIFHVPGGDGASVYIVVRFGNRSEPEPNARSAFRFSECLNLNRRAFGGEQARSNAEPKNWSASLREDNLSFAGVSAIAKGCSNTFERRTEPERTFRFKVRKLPEPNLASTNLILRVPHLPAEQRSLTRTKSDVYSTELLWCSPLSSHAHRGHISVPAGLSQHESQFLAGVLNHMWAVVALTLPTTASYKPMMYGVWSGGTYVCYGTDREAPIYGGQSAHLIFRETFVHSPK